MNRTLSPFLVGFVLLTATTSKIFADPDKPLIKLDGEINDRLIQSTITTQADKWLKAGEATKSEELAAQLDRKTCSLKLAKPGKRVLTAQETSKKNQAGVLVVAQPYLCGKCERTHLSLASGFMLTEDGAFCTSYHVMSNKTARTMIIMTGDGRVAPVREVLAANAATDLIILRAEGKGFTALPLSTNAPVGGLIRVISHPNQHFYSLTEGIASRYFTMTRNRKPVSALAITADFARGSSGAPVFNEYGAVVGSVNSTFSSYYSTDDDGHKENLQMVFKNCVAAKHVLEMIKGE